MSNPNAHHHKHRRPEPHHTTGGGKPKPRVHPALWYGIGVALTAAVIVVWVLFN
ncbi:MAG: hypothetical protein U0804_13335 [Gemmataceae bacterium]